MPCMPDASAWDFAQDWLDIDFAIRERVDFIAVSFVKSADVIRNLKSYLNSRADKVPLRFCLRGARMGAWSPLKLFIYN